MPVKYLEDLCADPRIAGGEPSQWPFIDKTAAQRGTMLCNALPQAMCIEGAELPIVYSGSEAVIGQYEYDTTERDEDITIRAVIPKYRHYPEETTYTFIGVGHTSKKLTCFDLANYTKLSEGFGYRNTKINKHLLRPEVVLEKETKLYHSPSLNNGVYMQGVNLNCGFMSLTEAAEDAIIIADDKQDCFDTRAIYTDKGMISSTKIPLIRYGSEFEPKCFPDIGEYVNPDGVIMAFRSFNKSTIMSDLSLDSLRELDLHDDPIMAPVAEGVKIEDIKIVINPAAARRMSKKPGIYAQFLNYHNQTMDYYKRVIDAYVRYGKDVECDHKFNTLVTKAMAMTGMECGRPATPLNPVLRKEPIDFIYYEITYSYVRKASNGSKFTGRDGSKGVMVKFWPADWMPYDEQGIRMDMIIGCETPVNRTNEGQLYEQFLGRGALLIRKRIETGEVPASKAYDYVMGFLEDLWPYGANVYRQRIEARKGGVEEFIGHILDDNLQIWLPPFLKHAGPDKMLSLEKKYDLQESPVTFTKLIGGEEVTTTTNESVCIGPKYIYNLGKIPLDQLSAVEGSTISQHRLPIKPGMAARRRFPFRQTPQRLGEDELCIMSMSLAFSVVARHVGVAGMSPAAAQLLYDELMTRPEPTRLEYIDMTTEEIISKNVNIGLCRHTMGTCGIGTIPGEENIQR